jgi:hypothetical protein
MPHPFCKSTHAHSAPLANALRALQPSRVIKLYKFVHGGTAGTWQLVTANASPRFYNANEDSGPKSGPSW